jgi:hypothetical protein
MPSWVQTLLSKSGPENKSNVMAYIAKIMKLRKAGTPNPAGTAVPAPATPSSESPQISQMYGG